MQLGGSAHNGTLAPVQDGMWVLSAAAAASKEDGGFELNDVEKNWIPFVHNNTLYLSYSLQVQQQEQQNAAPSFLHPTSHTLPPPSLPDYCHSHTSY